MTPIVEFIFSHTNINQINLLLTLSYFPLWTMTVVDNIVLPPSPFCKHDSLTRHWTESPPHHNNQCFS